MVVILSGIGPNLKDAGGDDAVAAMCTPAHAARTMAVLLTFRAAQPATKLTQRHEPATIQHHTWRRS